MLDLKAPGKVNLGLHVTAKRFDGFHEIDTLFLRLDIHDKLFLEPTDKGISLTVEGAVLPSSEENLCYQAAERYLKAYKRVTGKNAGVSMHLKKELPVAAGLGGGSSDAATVLQGLSTCYPAEIALFDLGLALGSDVPFFLLNCASARGRGRGEKLEPLALPDVDVVLVNPRIKVSAAEAYKALKRFDDPLNVRQIQTSLAAHQAPHCFNSLQAGVIELYPDIKGVLATLTEVGLKGALMSGSGSTCFAIADSELQARKAANLMLEKHPNAWVKVAKKL